MLSIKTKIVLFSALVFGAALAAFSVVIYHNVERAEVEKIDAILDGRWKAVRDEVDEDFDEETVLNIPKLQALAAARLPGTELVLRTAENAVMMAEDRSATELWTSLRGAAIPDTNTARGEVAFNGERARFYYAPIRIHHETRFNLLIVAPMREAEERLGALRVQFILAIPLALLLASLGAWIIARMAFRPVTRMITTSSAITADNLDLRLELPRARDEVRMLGETLNEMIGRIASAFRSQQQFAADASHELRTPLTVIRTELEYALRTVQDPAARESIGIALGETDRLAQMAAQLLQLSKLDASHHALKRERVRLDELASDAVLSFRAPASKKGVAIEFADPGAIEYECDEEKLASALKNIIENAVNYTPEGGAVRVGLARLNGSIHIAVEDSGCGIDETDRPHIFSRFYRGTAVRGTTEGSGLGLAIAEKIVALHGGRIELRANSPRGSVFTIVLPSA